MCYSEVERLTQESGSLRHKVVSLETLATKGFKEVIFGYLSLSSRVNGIHKYCFPVLLSIAL